MAREMTNFEAVKSLSLEDLAVFMAISEDPNDYWRKGQVQYYIDYFKKPNGENLLDSVKTLKEGCEDFKDDLKYLSEEELKQRNKGKNNEMVRKILNKIKNKEDLEPNELRMLECILAGYEAFDEKMNEVLGLLSKK